MLITLRHPRPMPMAYKRASRLLILFGDYT
jgi:hypothetical protein